MEQSSKDQINIFPVITHIDQVREAITGAKEFEEKRKDDYITFNYKVRIKQNI
jgi:hypothetical protein